MRGGDRGDRRSSRRGTGRRRRRNPPRRRTGRWPPRPRRAPPGTSARSASRALRRTRAGIPRPLRRRRSAPARAAHAIRRSLPPGALRPVVACDTVEPMNGTAVSQPRQTPDLAATRWLLLTHHLPPSPAYFRVRIRRRLAAIGAVPVRNAVYALPASDATREDFEWLLREIVADGGEATLCEAVFIDGDTDRRLRAAFDGERSAAYAAIVEEADRARAARAGSPAVPATLEELKRRLGEAEARDFFHARGRAEAENAVSILEMEIATEAEEGEMAGDEGTIERAS